jgi:hypothetical protein
MSCRCDKQPLVAFSAAIEQRPAIRDSGLPEKLVKQAGSLVLIAPPPPSQGELHKQI